MNPLWILILLLDASTPQPSGPSPGTIECYRAYRKDFDACETYYACHMAITLRYQSCIRREPIPI